MAKALPPIPRSIKLAAGRVLVARKKKMLETTGDAGEYDYAKRKITLDSALEVNPAWIVLRHERAHAVLMDAGITVWPDTDANGRSQLEESICDAFASADVAEMLTGGTRRKRDER